MPDEVTKEMIEAGLREYAKRDTDWLETDSDIVVRIYLAMRKASADTQQNYIQPK